MKLTTTRDALASAAAWATATARVGKAPATPVPGGLLLTAEAAWFRDLRDRCTAGGIPFFFKQWGGPTPKAGGRLLDGRTWDEMPATTLTRSDGERVTPDAPQSAALIAPDRTYRQA